MLNVISIHNKKGIFAKLTLIWFAILGLLFTTESLIAQENEDSKDMNTVEQATGGKLIEEASNEADDADVAEDNVEENVASQSGYFLVADPLAVVQIYSAEEFFPALGIDTESYTKREISDKSELSDSNSSSKSTDEEKSDQEENSDLESDSEE